MKKILISDAVDKKSVLLLEQEGFDVTYSPGISSDELYKIIDQFSGLIVRSSTQVTAKLIERMDNMEVIGRAGAGIDNIDIDAATRKGIIVMNTPGGNTISTAEHTMALMLSMCRHIPQANQSMREGKWDRKKYSGTELNNKTLGIIGLGKVGKEVALRAKAFGMNLIGFDPVLSSEVASKIGVKLVDLNELFRSSDIITVHVPLSNETKNLISKESLSKCKKGVKIINCARGGIVNEQDLLSALESSIVSSAAFDVYTTEPPDFNNELFKNSKIITTPHLGASTEEAQEKVAIQIAEQIIDLFKGNEIKGAVNAASIQTAGVPEIKPFIKLAESLGLMHAQLIKGKIKNIDINCSGELLHKHSTVISAAVQKGFLSFLRDEPINLINAPFISKEAGIVINEINSGSNSNYKNLITVNFNTDNESRILAGTVFGNNEIRIIKFDDYFVETKPEGNLLIYLNEDKPGKLAAVGKILAENNINIAGLSLGRKEAGKIALTIISIDSAIDENTLKSIEEINGIFDVKLLLLPSKINSIMND